MHRLGSTAARLKLKEIDGGPHKRRSMWLNSMQREEPYQGLTCNCTTGESRFPSRVLHRCCMAVVSSCREVLGQVPQRTQPLCLVATPDLSGSTLNRLPVQAGGRWGRRQVSMALTPWAAHVLQWSVQKDAIPRGGANPQSRPQFGLESETRLHEVGFASNGASATAP